MKARCSLQVIKYGAFILKLIEFVVVLFQTLKRSLKHGWMRKIPVKSWLRCGMVVPQHQQREVSAVETVAWGNQADIRKS